MVRNGLAVLLAATCATACATGGPTSAEADNHANADTTINDRAASIPFANYRGRIRDWRDLGREAMLLQTDTGNWYRATFMGSCHNLPFAETIGFVLDGTRQIDKFSSIVVRGAGGMVEECWFKSFEEVPAPN